MFHIYPDFQESDFQGRSIEICSQCIDVSFDHHTSIDFKNLNGKNFIYFSQFHTINKTKKV